MLISLNWIRDFVDLPGDVDPRELAEQFTRVTAEVDDVRPVRVGASGLIVARILSEIELPGTRTARKVTLDVGDGKTVETVSAAPILHVGHNVVFAPVGAALESLGEIKKTNVAGHASAGIILPGDAIGIPMSAREAIFLSDAEPPGHPLSPNLFEDWIIEIDNKSITNRPDLWGHYGVARELAAIYGCTLKPYEIVALDDLAPRDLPEVEIAIADATACPRYSGIIFQRVATQPAPLWMQLRLGHVGMRPISALVDLTNYVMADLGQPMHAFDAERVRSIEVDWAGDGELFRTLDGEERTLSTDTLMIKCEGRSIALAGVMGGFETEVTTATTALLLESANFNPATIRRTATRLGLRTDASARFEKSLDPANTVLGIQRFLHLAKTIYRDMEITSRLSDCYPEPRTPARIDVRPHHVHRTIGREVAFDEASRRLKPLGFAMNKRGATWRVHVPSYRSGNDVTIEADVVEEIARCIGYNNIEPALPHVTVRRFKQNALHELEQRTLEYFTTAHPFHEVHGYLWYDGAWLDRLGLRPGPCIEVSNPAAEGQHLLRRALMPGLLQDVERNRFHFSEVSIVELGSVFERGEQEDQEFRHVALVSARRGKRAEESLYQSLKGGVEGWAWDRFARRVSFSAAVADPQRPWEHAHRTADVRLDGASIGRISVINLSLRRAMDGHLAAWGIAWAELRLSGIEELARGVEPLEGIPPFPVVEMDFSVHVPASERFERIAERITQFEHPLLKRMHYVGSYEGESIAQDARSVTVRAIVGDDTRTLVDEDTHAFRDAFDGFLRQYGYEVRR